MRYIMKYFIKRLPREGWRSLSVPALALALVFLINVLAGIRLNMEAEYDSAMELPIYIEVSDGDGSATEGLMISRQYIAQFTDPDALWSLAPYVDDVRLKCTLNILDDLWSPPEGTLYGVMGDYGTFLAHADSKLTVQKYNANWEIIPQSVNVIAEHARVEFFEGYDAYTLTSNNWACVVSEDILSMAIDGIITVSIIIQRGQLTQSFDYDFTITGVLYGDLRGAVIGSMEAGETIRRQTNIGSTQQHLHLECDYYDVADIRFMDDAAPEGTLAAFKEYHITYINNFAEHEKSEGWEPWEYIEIFDGYDKTVFGTDERVCIISEDVLAYAQDGVLRFSGLDESGELIPIDTGWVVIGMLKGAGADEGMVIIPEAAMTGLGIPVRPYQSGPMANVYIAGFKLAKNVPIIGALSGVTSLELPGADTAELPGADAVQNRPEVSYYEGYDESMFATDKMACVISEDFLGRVEGGVLKFYAQSRAKTGAEPIDVELEVAGIIRNSEESSVYMPYTAAAEIAVQADGGTPYSELLRARLTDNRQLDEFKEIATRTFTRVGTFFNPNVFALMIYDAEFYDITEAYMQTIFFIGIATPFVYALAVCVGFAASFLLMRRRTGEFAIMRSVGVNKTGIFFGTLLEQALLCAAGAALGSLLFTLTWGYVFISQPLVFLACYMLGVLVSAAKAAGTDVLRLLREEE